MPRRTLPWRRLEQCSLKERRAQPDRCQERWYRMVQPRVVGKAVLDVGAASGYGCEIMERTAASVLGIDPLPLGVNVLPTPIEQIGSKSVDWAVAMDVIEHVEDDVGFLGHMLRVARETVFFSTPNWNCWQAGNEFHVREYTPDELRDLLNAFSTQIRGREIWLDEAANGTFVRNDDVPSDWKGMYFGVILELKP